DDPPRIVVDIAGKPTGSAAAARGADHAASRDAPAAEPSPPGESARGSDGGDARDSGAGARKSRARDNVAASKPEERSRAVESRSTGDARPSEHAESARRPES